MKFKKILSMVLSAVMLASYTTVLAEDTDTDAIIAKFSFSQNSYAEKTLDETYGGSAETGYTATNGMLKDNAVLYASIDGVNKQQMEWSNYEGNDGNDYVDSDETFIGASAVMAANADHTWNNPYFEIVSSTKGYTDITFSADIGGSKKGAKNFALSYSIDGIEYSPIENAIYSITANKTLENAFVNVPLPESANDADRIYIKIYATDTTAINGKDLSENPSGGENAINNITLKGKGKSEWMPTFECIKASSKDNLLSLTLKNVSGKTVSGKNILCFYNGAEIEKIVLSDITEIAENRLCTVECDITDIAFDTVKTFNLNNLSDIEPLGVVYTYTKDEIVPTPTPTPNPYSNEPAYQDIPTVAITGDITDISRENEKQVVLTYESSTETFTSYATIKWQGRSSVNQGYPKYNYNLKLYSDEAYSVKEKHQFKTWLPAYNYCLKANWIDSTHARNIVSARLGARIQKELMPTGVSGLIDGFPIHVTLNGEDQGIYTWNIPKKGWTFGFDSDNLDHIAFGAEQQTGACLFQTESTSDSDWEIIEPEDYPDQAREKFNRLITFVKDSTVEEFRANFDQYLDLDATLNYYVFAHIIGHTDGFAKNMIMVTYDGKVWHPSLYDMDSTYGLYWTGKKIISPEALLNPNNTDATMYNTSNLWAKLEQAFGNEIYARYVELRANELSDENIIAEFEYFMDGIGQELYDLDESVWEGVSSTHKYIPSRDFRLDQIKQYLIERQPYLEKWMQGLRTTTE